MKSYRLKNSIVGLVLIIVATFLYHGCYTGIETDNISPSAPPSSASESLYWVEIQERFYTNDLARAQAEIPFPIVLPTYVPDKRAQTPLPQIDGPLRISRDGNKVEVNIKYLLYLDNEFQGDVFITESNHHYSLGDPELNPDLKLIEIYGKRVIKTEDDFRPGAHAYFSFDFKDIYFVVDLINLPPEEGMKIIESMIKQME